MGGGNLSNQTEFSQIQHKQAAERKCWTQPQLKIVVIDAAEAGPPPGNNDVHPPAGTYTLS